MIDFESNVGLVYRVVNEDFASYVRFREDIEQEGMLGLWTACQTFDETRGTAFSTYATKCIKNRIAMYLRKELAYRSRVLSLDKLIDEDKGLATFVEEVYSSEDIDDKESIQLMKKYDAWGIIDLKLEGKTQRQIAKILNVNEATVSERFRMICIATRRELGILAEKNEKSGKDVKKNKKI